MKSGLDKIYPHTADYSLLHSIKASPYGAVVPDPQSLPANFSIYDGRPIPNQDELDDRFTPALRPLPYGCTGESQTFIGGLEDDALYDPADLYFNTPPGTDGVGRDMRASLQTTIDRGYKALDGTLGEQRTAYFNCYGVGAIDDFDAVRIALWINQAERRPVTVGSWWYPEFAKPVNGSVPVPSFDTRQATLHNHIITGWRTLDDGTVELESISWQGMNYGLNGLVYVSRVIYNALMGQPWTGAFTLTKATSLTPVPIGVTAIVDHLVYFVRQLFAQKKTL